MLEAIYTFLINSITDGLKGPFTIFVSPERRLFYIPLLVSLIIAYLVVCYQGKSLSLKRSLSIIFSKKLWLHPSSILDLKLVFTNSLFKALFITPWVIGSFTLTVIMIKLLRQYFGEFNPLSIDYSALLFLYTITTFIFTDFLRFFQHYLFHKIKFLWKFHQVHHSAEVLTPLSLHRAHPVEIVASSFRNILATSLPVAVFIFLFESHISGYDILGVNLFGFIFNLSASNLRHSQIWLGFGWLEHIFISPAQHQMHHSQKYEYCHSNYGVCLSIWDKAFGTLKLSAKKRDFSFGLPTKVRNHANKVSSVYFSPFKK